ncbi:conserved hypothetical protein [Leishmania major strain Friedlin]|uniref:MIP18 family-like domain-containing protein n=1 Tax=Leishmania major TaxID=5664 RepID=Q4QII6_LEIMA|nr:conserved hypothetical protein [Leishmania major strain Friedlin]CAJ07067.1 conserved hypothetical protein [Leishmania major strain Friedlin]|eukprot:XP_001681012.1 conserved hypothetical protein [Leishmania major strain Friedlin]
MLLLLFRPVYQCTVALLCRSLPAYHPCLLSTDSPPPFFTVFCHLDDALHAMRRRSCSLRRLEVHTKRRAHAIMAELANPNPTVFEPTHDPLKGRTDAERAAEDDEDTEDPIDAWEVFEMIRRIRDPEHPNSLEQLKVVEPSLITVDWKKRHIRVLFTPTVPHCSLTTLIGLSIRLQLERSLPEYTKVDIYVTPGTHEQEAQVNKQLNDKERVAAALENRNLLNVVESCINEFDE